MTERMIENRIKKLKEIEAQQEALEAQAEAIRAKCLECCCRQTKEVRLCSVKNCPLYEYRDGHRPKGGEDTAESEII